MRDGCSHAWSPRASAEQAETLEHTLGRRPRGPRAPGRWAGGTGRGQAQDAEGHLHGQRELGDLAALVRVGLEQAGVELPGPVVVALRERRRSARPSTSPHQWVAVPTTPTAPTASSGSVMGSSPDQTSKSSGAAAITLAVSPGFPAASLMPTMVGTSLARRTSRCGVDLAAGATGDVVDHHGQVRGGGDGAEVGLEAGLRRTVVVRRHDEQAVDAGGGRPLAELAGVAGVVAAGAGDERHVDGGAHRRPEVDLLVVRERGRLAGGAGQHEPVAAVVDEPAGQAHGAVEVERRRRRGTA